MTPPIITADAARRLLMGAQGLLDDPARAASVPVLRKLIERMGFVQLDSINVVERAPHLTLGSRLDDYSRAHFSALLEKERSLFEHWTHDASAVPTKWFAHWKPRFERDRGRVMASRWWRERMGSDPLRVIDEVRERVAREGPLRSQDFERDAGGGGVSSSAWWGWKPQKAALEFLWTTGELMVLRRENFQKVYDLTERVLPAHSAAPRPDEREHVEWACGTALERLGVATPRELAQFWDAVGLSEAKTWCEEALREGRVTAVVVEAADGSKPRHAFAVADWERRLQALPAPPERTRLLSPFDPVLRDRARARRLFGFDYRFEAFVPEPQRQYGYYVLPILEGDRLIGRLDPKFERREGLLNVRRVYWEPNVRATRPRLKGLERAAERLAQLIGASRVALPR
ncbi:MAG TPA: crosslink repair DNA glycosylase YcaQ family protein [Pyrinomonadaceae bacterium]|nr:crosslink repair DNA glycosylase YcaQ family protein [Pyrinomonadaceae bacterium]